MQDQLGATYSEGLSKAAALGGRPIAAEEITDVATPLELCDPCNAALRQLKALRLKAMVHLAVDLVPIN